MHVREVVAALERIAPPEMAAEWDNVGLLLGDPADPVRTLLLCIDLTAPVLAEAEQVGAEMILAYHPVIFKAASRLTATATPVTYAAARRGLAVYCPHTALDAAPGGTNDVLADVLGLAGPQPLEPSVGPGACKVVVFTPADDLSQIAEAAFAAGAGRVGEYAECSFFTHGIGTFRGQAGTQPAIGIAGRHEAAEEVRLEITAPRNRTAAVCAAIRAAHRYDEPVVDVHPLEAHRPGFGMGRIGRLERAVSAATLLRRLKQGLGVPKVLRAAPPDGPAGSAKVSIAACCAGSCGSLVQAALRGGATFYLTGEMRHHDALAAAAEGMTVVCVGHSNSERIALGRLAERLTEALPELRTHQAERDVDPFEVV